MGFQGFEGRVRRGRHSLSADPRRLGIREDHGAQTRPHPRSRCAMARIGTPIMSLDMAVVTRHEWLGIIWRC